MSGNNGKPADPKDVLMKHIMEKYAREQVKAFKEAVETSLKDSHQNISKSFFKMFVFQQYQITVCIKTIELLTSLLKHKGVIEAGEFEELCKNISLVELPNEDGKGDSERDASEGQDGPGDTSGSVPTELHDQARNAGSAAGKT